MRTFVLATANAHKLSEVRAILGPEYSVRSMSEFAGAPKPEETADSFRGNALIKSVALALWLCENRRVPTPDTSVLADDSGLEVVALAGAPGVQSARFAALDDGRPGNSSDRENNAKLLRLLEAIPTATRAARFRCVLALTPCVAPVGGALGVGLEAFLASQTSFFEGTCDGTITSNAVGTGGFGYDPHFIPSGFDRTMAALGEAEKNRISHRAKALAMLCKSLHSQA